MQKIRLGLLCGAMLALSGCATIFGDNSRAIHINTAPSGATIIVDNGQTSISTPGDVVVPTPWSPTTIRVEKTGYQTQTFVVDPIFQPVGLWNILFWPGFIVDACTGDMMRVPVESRNFTAILVPAGKAKN